MRRILFSLALITSISALSFALTSAFFSDTETSQGNNFAAGAVDLKIDNTSYYNGIFNPDTSWTLTDLVDHKFFNFTDLKPGDVGEDTISIHVEDNDAWACFDLTITANDDNTCTEPELIDDPTCSAPGENQGELADQVNFVFWVDDGDNVLEDNETESILAQGTAADMPSSMSGALADATTNRLGGQPGDPLIGTQTYYIAKAWCFGELGLLPYEQDDLGFVSNEGGNGPDVRLGGGISCVGNQVDNSAQTDILLGDFSFRAEQHRNNPNFVCDPNGGPFGSPTPSPSPSPTPQACIDDADVMLVLDRSGSINSTELASLKTAASDFVTSLNPSLAGAHIGQASFATTASLDSHLTDNAATVLAAINGLSNGGFTNLYSGLLTAETELANPGDGHDRSDLTSPDYYVVITDGNPNRPLPADGADDLAASKASDIIAGDGTIYVVGVGADVDATYLQNEIASEPGNYFSAENYEDLSSILQGIVETCDN